MAAAAMVICGHKRPFFEEPESTIPTYKKLRHCSPLLPPATADHIHHTSQANDTTDASSAKNQENSMVESFVKEMACAASLDDARSRASRALEVFKRSIAEKVSADFVEENRALNERIEGLNREKAVLIKRVVEIEMEYEDRNREVEKLKELVGQWNEKVRMLEVKNYALAMHLKQAQQCTSSIPMRFHPDVF